MYLPKNNSFLPVNLKKETASYFTIKMSLFGNNKTIAIWDAYAMADRSITKSTLLFEHLEKEHALNALKPYNKYFYQNDADKPFDVV